MKDEKKTKKQLIKELEELRKQVADFNPSEIDHRKREGENKVGKRRSSSKDEAGLRSSFESLAEQLRQLGKEEFLRQVNSPFLVQMRSYKTTRVESEKGLTSGIDSKFLQSLLSQSSTTQEFPREVIPLVPQKGSCHNPFRCF